MMMLPPYYNYWKACSKHFLYDLSISLSFFQLVRQLHVLQRLLVVRHCRRGGRTSSRRWRQLPRPRLLPGGAQAAKAGATQPYLRGGRGLSPRGRGIQTLGKHRGIPAPSGS